MKRPSDISSRKLSIYSKSILSIKRALAFFILIFVSKQALAQSITIDGVPSDWPAVLNSSSIPVKLFTHDVANSTTDNIFSLGPKDTDPVSSWGWTSGSSTAPIRDIENAGAALIGSNLYFFGDRFDTTTAGQTKTWVGVWFLLNAVAPAAGNTFSGSHAVGDILVLFEIGAGYQTLQLEVYEWVGSGGSDGSLNFLTTTTNAAVNNAQQAVPVFPGWTYDGLGGTSSYSTRTFFEGYMDVGNLSNRCFKSFLIETRSSIAVSASLFDFASGAFGGNVDQDNDGYTVCNDCDDNDPNVNPGATEICDGIDNNCNGQIDEGFTLNTYYADADNDGYGNPSVSVQRCSPPPGYVTNNSDCNDSNAAINPAATEICDGVDNNCNGQTDEGLALTTYYADADHDGYGNPSVSIQRCSPPSGYVTNNGDCNDNNANINPGVSEICGNNIDDNCNGSVDEGCAAITVSINNVTAYEGVGTATLTVSLSNPISQTLKVSYQTIDGSAISKGKNKDFMSSKGSVVIPAGQVSVPITVTIYNDGIAEGPEFFTVQISLAKNVSGVTISKSDGQVQISDGNAPLAEPITKINTQQSINETKTLSVKATANPFTSNLNLIIQSPVNGVARIEFFTINGQKLDEISKPVIGSSITIVSYKSSSHISTLVYKVTIGKSIATGIALNPN